MCAVGARLRRCTGYDRRSARVLRSLDASHPCARASKHAGNRISRKWERAGRARAAKGGNRFCRIGTGNASGSHERRFTRERCGFTCELFRDFAIDSSHKDFRDGCRDRFRAHEQ